MLGAVLRRGPADEGEVGQIPRQADAAADDDVGLRAGAAQPLAAVVASDRSSSTASIRLPSASRSAGFRRAVREARS